jgi:hypothetical protein
VYSRTTDSRKQDLTEIHLQIERQPHAFCLASIEVLRPYAQSTTRLLVNMLLTRFAESARRHTSTIMPLYPSMTSPSCPRYRPSLDFAQLFETASFSISTSHIPENRSRSGRPALARRRLAETMLAFERSADRGCRRACEDARGTRRRARGREGDRSPRAGAPAWGASDGE